MRVCVYIYIHINQLTYLYTYASYMDRFSALGTIREVEDLLRQRVANDTVDPYDRIYSERRIKELISIEGKFFSYILLSYLSNLLNITPV